MDEYFQNLQILISENSLKFRKSLLNFQKFPYMRSCKRAEGVPTSKDVPDETIAENTNTNI